MEMSRAVLSESARVVYQPRKLQLLVLSGLMVLWMLGASLGCGSSAGIGVSTRGTSPGKTTVTLIGTSTANDQLSDYDLVLNSLTLTNSNGQAVSVLTSPLHVEFMHLNGVAEPLVTLNIPQGTYTSAAATVGVARFDCIALNSSDAIATSAFAYDQTPASNVSVNVPAPITIGSTATTLSLSLDISKSAAWTSCAPTGLQPYSITPTFTLSSQLVSSQRGAMTDLEGQVASPSASTNTFSVTAADGQSCAAANPSSCSPASASGPTWQVDVSQNTVFQGVTNISQLQAGMPVDMDGLLQPNGSVLASRIAVLDVNPVDLTGEIGPLLFVSNAWPALANFGPQAWGPIATGGGNYFNFSGAVFQVSGQFTNLQNLPFNVSFAADNMVAGQRLFVTSHATSVAAGPAYAAATTITLLPQVIDGTVSAVSSDGGFDTYTVILAPYDLFPQLATQSGQTTLLQNPNTIVVYADDNTQMLDTNPVAVGSVLRFNGLIFNDNGTLRMDCAWVEDGVTE